MNNFSDLNHLPVEVKTLIVKGQDLADKAKEVMGNRRYNFDLTSKRELKSNIKNVEKNISLLAKGKVSEKSVKALENSIIRLRTVLDGMINYFG